MAKETEKKQELIVKALPEGGWGIYGKEKGVEKQLGYIGSELPLEEYMPEGAVLV